MTMTSPEYSTPQPMSEEEAAAAAARILGESPVGAEMLTDINEAEASGTLDSVPESDVSNEVNLRLAQQAMDPLVETFNLPAYDEEPPATKEL